MVDRPKIAPEAFARVNITCRVCDRTLEAYVLEGDDKREPTLHDVAFQAANQMQTHLIVEHGYLKAGFSK